VSFWFRYLTKARSEGFPENIIENLPEIACIIGDGGRFKRWNSNLESALGYTAEEVRRITALETIAEDQREFVRGAMAEVLAHGMAKAERVLVSKDGTRIRWGHGFELAGSASFRRKCPRPAHAARSRSTSGGGIDNLLVENGPSGSSLRIHF
jgi:PAS domain S-box-containing protein